VTARDVVLDGGVRLHVEEVAEGRSPAVVLLHGFGASSRTWEPLHDGLAAMGRRVLAFDRVGFGDSDRPRRPRHGWGEAGSPYRPSLAGDHTLAVLDANGVDEAVLVGHSAGAVGAVLAALAAPGRITGLGLLAPAVLQDGPPRLVAASFSVPGAAVVAPWVLRRSAGLLAGGLRRTWQDPARVTDAVLDRYRAPLRRPGWEHALVEMTRATERLDLASRLHRVDVPAVVVTGAGDRIVRPADAERVASLLGGPVTCTTVPDAGHLVHEEQPAAVLEALAPLLG
jgi:pimeloyl-ACP methyl ester carboxylesterase